MLQVGLLLRAGLAENFLSRLGQTILQFRLAGAIQPAADKPAPDKPKPEAKEKDGKTDLPKVTIDLENIDQRIVSIPMPNRNYAGLVAGKAGTVYLLEGEPVFMAGRAGPPGGFTVHKFDLTKRKPEKLLDGATQFALSHNGEKMLYRLGPDKWFLTAAGAAPMQAAHAATSKAMIFISLSSSPGILSSRKSCNAAKREPSRRTREASHAPPISWRC